MFLLPVSEKHFPKFQSVVFLTFGPTFFLTGTNKRKPGVVFFCFRVYGLRLLLEGHAHIYIYMCFYCQFQKIFLSKISECCVFDIWTHTFSDRYELMETGFCVFCFRVYGLGLLFEGHAQTYIYICFYCQFQKNNFVKFSKCCVFDIWTHTFSDRYELMETRCCVFCFRVYGLRLLLEGHAHIYIYIYMCVFIASFRKYFV